MWVVGRAAAAWCALEEEGEPLTNRDLRRVVDPAVVGAADDDAEDDDDDADDDDDLCVLRVKCIPPRLLLCVCW